MLVSKTSGLINLNDACREAHDALAEVVREQIAARKKHSIPLDDDTDFATVEEKAIELKDAASEMDGAKAREIAVQIAGMTGGGLRELAPFEPVEDYEDVKVRLRSVPERVRIETREEIDACATAGERHETFKRYVGRAYEEIVGIETEDGPVEIKRDGDALPGDALELLDAAGLIGDLWAVARRYAEIPPSKKKRFGSRQPSAYRTSDATGAASGSDGSEGATAALASTDSPSTTTTPVPAGTF